MKKHLQTKNKIFHKNEGFTIVESLITLFIISIFLFIPIISVNKITEKIQVNLVFKELETSISLMQNHALLTGQRSAVHVLPSQNALQFRIYDGTPYGEHLLEHQIRFDEDIVKIKKINTASVYFIGNTGDITVNDGSAWTTPFSTAKGDYDLVFQLGSGRFEIRKK